MEVSPCLINIRFSVPRAQQGLFPLGAPSREPAHEDGSGCDYGVSSGDNPALEQKELQQIQDSQELEQDMVGR